MNYAVIKKTDVANGPGVRVSLFVSGCTHGCKGCFNSEAWDFEYGSVFTGESEREILEALEPEYIKGLSVLGGEPMEPSNRETVLGLLEKVHERFPEKTIWCYTGYDYEKDLLRWEAEENADGREGVMSGLLRLIDVLVDGEFVIERKNLRLAFRGSENQRLIDVKKSRRQGVTVCLDL